MNSLITLSKRKKKWELGWFSSSSSSFSSYLPYTRTYFLKARCCSSFTSTKTHPSSSVSCKCILIKRTWSSQSSSNSVFNSNNSSSSSSSLPPSSTSSLKNEFEFNRILLPPLYFNSSYPSRFNFYSCNVSPLSSSSSNTHNISNSDSNTKTTKKKKKKVKKEKKATKQMKEITKKKKKGKEVKSGNNENTNLLETQAKVTRKDTTITPPSTSASPSPFPNAVPIPQPPPPPTTTTVANNNNNNININNIKNDANPSLIKLALSVLEKIRQGPGPPPLHGVIFTDYRFQAKRPKSLLVSPKKFQLPNSSSAMSSPYADPQLTRLRLAVLKWLNEHAYLHEEDILTIFRACISFSKLNDEPHLTQAFEIVGKSYTSNSACQPIFSNATSTSSDSDSSSATSLVTEIGSLKRDETKTELETEIKEKEQKVHNVKPHLDVGLLGAGIKRDQLGHFNTNPTNISFSPFFAKANPTPSLKSFLYKCRGENPPVEKLKTKEPKFGDLLDATTSSPSPTFPSILASTSTSTSSSSSSSNSTLTLTSSSPSPPPLSLKQVKKLQAKQNSISAQVKLAKKNAMSIADMVMNHLHQQHSIPSVSIYTAYLLVCAHTEQLDRALDCFDTIQRQGLLPNTMLARAFLLVCLRCNDLPALSNAFHACSFQALQTWKSNEKMHLWLFRFFKYAMLPTLAIAGYLQWPLLALACTGKLLLVMYLQKTWPILTDRSVVNLHRCLLKTLTPFLESSHLDQIHTYLSSKYANVNWTSILNSSSILSKFPFQNVSANLISFIYTSLPTKHISFFPMALSQPLLWYFYDEKQYPVVLALYESLTGSNPKHLNINLLTTVISSYGKVGQPKKAKELFEWYLNNSKVPPCLFLLNTMLSVLGKNGLYKEAEELVEKDFPKFKCQPNLATYLKLIERSQYAPDANHLVPHLGWPKAIERSYYWYQQWISSNHPETFTSVEASNLLLFVCNKFRRYDLAKWFYTMLKVKDEETFHLLAWALEANPNVTFKEMISYYTPIHFEDLKLLRRLVRKALAKKNENDLSRMIELIDDKIHQIGSSNSSFSSSSFSSSPSSADPSVTMSISNSTSTLSPDPDPDIDPDTPSTFTSTTSKLDSTALPQLNECKTLLTYELKYLYSFNFNRHMSHFWKRLSVDPFSTSTSHLSPSPKRPSSLLPSTKGNISTSRGNNPWHSLFLFDSEKSKKQDLKKKKNILV